MSHHDGIHSLEHPGHYTTVADIRDRHGCEAWQSDGCGHHRDSGIPKPANSACGATSHQLVERAPA